MYCADPNIRRNRLWAAAATLLYVLVWGLLVLLVTFKIHTPEPVAEGLLIDFGNADTGFGADDLSAADEPADAATSQDPSTESDPVAPLTQQIEEAPAVPTPTDPTPTAEPPRQVNRQALFPGRASANASASEGTAGGPGNQGDPAGDPVGAHEGTGMGTGGDSYALSGRSLVGALPKPAYNARAQGRVVIEVHVDQQGRVTRAVFRSVGSTTTNATLVAAAERAARAARFDVKEDAPVTQTGTITYNFRME